jgi:SEC-C motif-containing protein
MPHPLAVPCPCGLPLSYGACCGSHHAGRPAASAEALMRSRYSAYVLALDAYLRATWHPSTRPAAHEPLIDAKTRWLGLTIKRHEVSAADRAGVEFIARYKIGGRAHRLHERSRFVREDGQWYYLDGEFIAPANGAP